MRPNRDLDACAREWAALRPEALAALTERQLHIGAQPSTTAGTSSSAAEAARRDRLAALVRRFRRLRESLTACGALDARTVRDVFELSADVAAAARDDAELLKALQGLVNAVYPRLDEEQQEHDGAAAAADAQRGGGGAASGSSEVQQQQQQQQQQRQTDDAWGDDDDGGGGSGGGGGGINGSAQAPARAATAAASAAIRPSRCRRAEVHAALLLWFLCVPARPVHAEVAKRLRATPPALLRAPEVRAALAAASALCRGNWVQLGRLEAAPPLVRYVLAAGAPAARGRAARALAVAYRSLPRAAALAAIGGLPGGGGNGGGGETAAGDDTALRDALTAARDALGCRYAGVALAALDEAGGSPVVELKFR